MRVLILFLVGVQLCAADCPLDLSFEVGSGTSCICYPGESGANCEDGSTIPFSMIMYSQEALFINMEFEAPENLALCFWPHGSVCQNVSGTPKHYTIPTTARVVELVSRCAPNTPMVAITYTYIDMLDYALDSNTRPYTRTTPSTTLLSKCYSVAVQPDCYGPCARTATTSTSTTTLYIGLGAAALAICVVAGCLFCCIQKCKRLRDRRRGPTRGLQSGFVIGNPQFTAWAKDATNGVDIGSNYFPLTPDPNVYVEPGDQPTVMKINPLYDENVDVDVDVDTEFAWPANDPDEYGFTGDTTNANVVVEEGEAEEI